jgi:ferredoxin-NADP reductase
MWAFRTLKNTIGNLLRDRFTHSFSLVTPVVGRSDWMGYRRRIDKAMLTEVLNSFAIQPQCFVCGSTQLVEQVANTFVDLGLPSHLIRTEQFG